MALEMYISPDGELPSNPEPGSVYRLFQDEFYGFLEPFLELFRQRTGVVVDLHEDSELSGVHLATFHGMLKAVEEELANRTHSEWAVHIPKRPSYAEEFVMVNQQEIQASLEKLIEFTERALKQGHRVVLMGD
jgi:hypothetical protein